MNRNLKCLGIKQAGDIRSLIETNNNLPYKERDSRLSALYDIIVEYNSTAPKKDKITSSDDAYACLSPMMRDLGQEEVWVVFLNKAQDVMQIKRMFVGGLDCTIVDNKIIIKEAIMMSASGIILAHNHPSGVAKPSKQDVAMTEKLKKAASICDINLLDHLIISRNKFYSFADEGNIC